MLADGDLMVCKKLLYFQYLMDQINLKDEKSHFSFDLVLELHNKYFDLFWSNNSNACSFGFYPGKMKQMKTYFFLKISIYWYLSDDLIYSPDQNLSTTIAT